MNIQERDGNTGLMYACSIGNEQVVETLLEAHHRKCINIIFDLSNSRGQTAMDCAQTMHRDKILKVFSKYSITVGSRFKPTVFKTKREPSARQRKQDSKGRQKQTTASTVLAGSDTEDELEEFGKLVRTMRECAAEVKQLCYDQNISYDNKRHKSTKSRKTERQKMDSKMLNTPRIEIHPDLSGQKNSHKRDGRIQNSNNSPQVARSVKQREAPSPALSPRVPGLELPTTDRATSETAVLSDSAIVSKRKNKKQKSATKHSADFRELSVDTICSKGESLHLHTREPSAKHRSATSPAVLQSAFRDPWSTFGEPLPGIQKTSSSTPLYLPPLKTMPGGKSEDFVSGKVKNAGKDIWQLREVPPASREDQDR